MEDTYRTLERPAEGVFRDKNSRFLAFGFPVENTGEIEGILSSTRKRYHDARHHCYAYRIGIDTALFRMHDDGEPSGTAGKPIYNQLISQQLNNVLVIVVRYFGGTLLGTGGLINAYRSATCDMLSRASVINRYVEHRFKICFPYDKLSAVMKLLKEENMVPGNPVYDTECTMFASIRRSKSDHVRSKLTDIPGLILETS